MKQLILLASLGALVGFVSPAQSETLSQPNVVVIVSDDMGWADVGYHGSTVRTPSIDRIGREGVELDRFYVFPICSPTRTALLTARSPIRFGILSPLGGGGAGIPAGEHFLPESFQKAGYQTWMTGKWHLGKGADEGPQRRGFDHFYGFLGGAVDYYEHTGGRGIDWQRNGATVEEEGYSSDLFAKEAVDLLKRRNKHKPVFLYLPFNAPHSPFQAPDEIIADYEKLGLDQRTAARAASITAMDKAIGVVLTALDDEGIADNTIVLFFCDNGAGSRGGRAGRRSAASGETKIVIGNAPLKSGKGSVYEGGIRVPAVMRWPGTIKPGTECDQFISVLDVLPTLAEAAGVSLQVGKPLDGASAWSVITGESSSHEKRAIVVATPRARAVIEDPWKLVKGGDDTFLYNVREDAFEKNDVSEDHPESVQQLEKALAPFDTFLKKTGRPTERRGRKR